MRCVNVYKNKNNEMWHRNKANEFVEIRSGFALADVDYGESQVSFIVMKSHFRIVKISILFLLRLTPVTSTWKSRKIEQSTQTFYIDYEMCFYSLSATMHRIVLLSFYSSNSFCSGSNNNTQVDQFKCVMVRNCNLTIKSKSEICMYTTSVVLCSMQTLNE